MSQELIQRVQFLEAENKRLVFELNKDRPDYQEKYKKALKEITAIVQANRQLQAELERMRNQRQNQSNTIQRIEKDQLVVTHERVLAEKTQLLIVSQSQAREIEQLKIQISTFNRQIEIIKDEKRKLQQQKEALQSLSPSKRGGLQDASEKETELRKTIERLEQEQDTTNNEISIINEYVSDLKVKLNEKDRTWRLKLQAKEMEIIEMRGEARNKSNQQNSGFKRQIIELMKANAELTARLQSQDNRHDSFNEDSELIETLRELKIQMEPMRLQIMELQHENQEEREKAMREKVALEMKVADLESELTKYNETIKLLEERLTRQSSELSVFENQKKLIRKLEEENKMLGGRVIVLECKEVGSRNRDGDPVEERVTQFQSHINMLLAEKENYVSVKSVSVEQLLTLRTEILELDTKLKVSHRENDSLTKKYRNYKERYTNSIRQLNHAQTIIDALHKKIEGYDDYVARMHAELVKVIKDSESESQQQQSPVNSQPREDQQEIWRKKYILLTEKMELQEKHASQQLETMKLHYETKLIDFNSKVEDHNNLREAVQLYKTKNEDLTARIAELEDELYRNQIDQRPIVNYEEQISMLTSTVRAQSMHITKLETQMKLQQENDSKRINQLNYELSMARNEVHKVGHSSEQMRDMDTVQQRLQSRIYQIQNELKQTVMAFSSSERKAQQLLLKLNEANFDKNDLINKLQTENSMRIRLEDRFNEVQRDSLVDSRELAALKSSSAATINGLYQQINVKVQIIQKMQIQLNETRAQVTSIYALSSMRDENSRLKDELEKLEGKYYRLERRFQESQSELQRTIEIDQRPKATFGTSSVSHTDSMNLKSEVEKKSKEALQYQEQLKVEAHKYVELQSRTFDLQDMVEKLKKDLQLKSAPSNNKLNDNAIFEKQIEIKKLTSENSFLSQKIQSVESSWRDMDRERLRLLEELNSLEEKIATREFAKCEKLFSHRIKLMEDQLEESNRQLDSYKEQFMKWQSTARTLETDVDDFKLAEERQKREMESLKSRLASLEETNNELNDIIAKKADAEKDLKRKLTAAESMEEEVGYQYKREISSLQVNHKILEEMNTQQQAEISKLQQDVSSWKSKFESKQSEMENEILRKNLEATQLNKKLLQSNSYSVRIDELESDIRKLSSSLSSKQSQIARLQSELAQLHSANGALSAERKSQQRLVEEKDGQLDEVSGYINQQNSLLSQRQRQVQERDTMIEELSQALNLNRKELLELKSSIQEYNATLLAQDTRIKNMIASAQRFAGIEEELVTKDKLISKTNIDFQSLKKQLASFQAEYEKEITVQRKLQSELKEAKLKLSESQFEIQQKTLKVTHFEKEISSYRNNYGKASSAEVNQLRQLRQQKTLVEKYNKEASLKVTQLSEQIIQLKTTISAYERKITQLQNYTNEAQPTQSPQQDLLEYNSQLEAQIQNLQQWISQQHQTLEQNREYIESKDNQFFALQQQVQRIKSEAVRVKYEPALAATDSEPRFAPSQMNSSRSRLANDEELIEEIRKNHNQMSRITERLQQQRAPVTIVVENRGVQELQSVIKELKQEMKSLKNIQQGVRSQEIIDLSRFVQIQQQPQATIGVQSSTHYGTSDVAVQQSGVQQSNQRGLVQAQTIQQTNAKSTLFTESRKGQQVRHQNESTNIVSYQTHLTQIVNHQQETEQIGEQNMMSHINVLMREAQNKSSEEEQYQHFDRGVQIRKNLQQNIIGHQNVFQSIETIEQVHQDTKNHETTQNNQTTNIQTKMVQNRQDISQSERSITQNKIQKQQESLNRQKQQIQLQQKERLIQQQQVLQKQQQQQVIVQQQQKQEQQQQQVIVQKQQQHQQRIQQQQQQRIQHQRIQQQHFQQQQQSVSHQTQLQVQRRQSMRNQQQIIINQQHNQQSYSQQKHIIQQQQHQQVIRNQQSNQQQIIQIQQTQQHIVQQSQQQIGQIVHQSQQQQQAHFNQSNQQQFQQQNTQKQQIQQQQVQQQQIQQNVQQQKQVQQHQISQQHTQQQFQINQQQQQYGNQSMVPIIRGTRTNSDQTAEQARKMQSGVVNMVTHINQQPPQQPQIVHYRRDSHFMPNDRSQQFIVNQPQPQVIVQKQYSPNQGSRNISPTGPMVMVQPNVQVLIQGTQPVINQNFRPNQVVVSNQPVQMQGPQYQVMHQNMVLVNQGNNRPPLPQHQGSNIVVGLHPHQQRPSFRSGPPNMTLIQSIPNQAGHFTPSANLPALDSQILQRTTIASSIIVDGTQKSLSRDNSKAKIPALGSSSSISQGSVSPKRITLHVEGSETFVERKIVERTVVTLERPTVKSISEQRLMGDDAYINHQSRIIQQSSVINHTDMTPMATRTPLAAERNEGRGSSSPIGIFLMTFNQEANRALYNNQSSPNKELMVESQLENRVAPSNNGYALSAQVPFSATQAQEISRSGSSQSTSQIYPIDPAVNAQGQLEVSTIIEQQGERNHSQ